MKKKRTARSIVEQEEKIVAVTAYDYTTGRLADSAEIDLVLVGDSLAQVIQGKSNTLSVTLDQMVYHCRCVTSATRYPLVVGDMPFLSFHISIEDTIRAAGRLIQEGGVDAVKLEGGKKRSSVIKALTDAEIPVLGHIGLTPQSYLTMGGFRIQGKETNESQAAFGEQSRADILSDALAIQEAGAFAVVVEGVPTLLGEEITKSLSIPTIGIGAGPHCRGQILVIHDLIGLTKHRPKFAKRYIDLDSQIATALKTFQQEVREGSFPDETFCY